ncbi:hypothetical protein CAP50_12195 [Psychrobacter sp. L7]|nr:hypothetical protein BTV99_11335 [Psychrobacter sp. Rd 27.2]PJX20605.1 hypothetical protein CAP50_12195 [Psychrobacter sp. L7]
MNLLHRSRFIDLLFIVLLFLIGADGLKTRSVSVLKLAALPTKRCNFALTLDCHHLPVDYYLTFLVQTSMLFLSQAIFYNQADCTLTLLVSIYLY